MFGLIVAEVEQFNSFSGNWSDLDVKGNCAGEASKVYVPVLIGSPNELTLIISKSNIT